MPDTRRIKILFVIPSLQAGGAEIQLLSLLRGLNKSEFDVTLGVFYQGNALDADFQSIQIKVVFLNKRHPLDFCFLSRLKNLIKCEKFDIVQAYNISARLFAIYYAKRAKVPFVIGTERTAKPLPTSLMSRIYLFAEKIALRACDLVITNSAAGRNYVESFGVSKSKVHIINNGIDPERLAVRQHKSEIIDEFKIPSHAFLIGMSARIEEIKDPITFVDIAALLKKDQSFYFMLIGDGPMLNAVRAYAAQKNVNSIIFTGYRSNIADFINALDVFVLTSKTVEGCSNALIEALALGVPAVVTDIGGNAQVVQHGKNGFLFQPGHAEQAVEHLLSLKHDKTLYTKFSNSAKKLAESHFSQAAMVAAYQKVYKQNTH